MASISSQPYKGTRDYYPEDKRLQNYVFSVWRAVSERFGYEEYGGPLLEPLEVYAAKSGQELVNDQTYSFTDRGSRQVAIRPEMTPTISRMVAARRQELSYPARLYSIANFMRYERPQRGREREFWQLNVDIFGLDGTLAEAEIIAMADEIMREFGAKDSDYVIRINNRKLINFVMAQYLSLSPAKALAMTKLLDRKNKITDEEFHEQAAVILDGNRAKNIKLNNLLSAKTMAELPEEIKTSDSIREIQELFTILDRAGISNTTFDIALMRGLDYYTGMVFEVFDQNPENSRSLFGGGRYDGLVGLFGSEPISAVGMAPGGTTMENFLHIHNLVPTMRSTTDILLVALDGLEHDSAVLASKMRQAGLNVELDQTGRKLDKLIKIAVKKSIPYMLFLGAEEIKTGVYSLKNVLKSEDKKMSLETLVAEVRRSK